MSYGGMLWILSGLGTLYRYVPGAPVVERVHELGEGFGQAPMLIREVRSPAPPAARDLWLLASDSREIKAVGLLDGRVRTVVRVAEPERILANCLQQSTAMEADSRRVYYLRQTGGGIFLEAWDFLRGEIGWSISLLVDEVSGVALAGDLAFAYSRDRVSGAGPTTGSSEGNATRLESVFPAGFEPRMRTSGRNWGPRPCPGRPVYLTYREWIYFPGRHRGAPAMFALNACGGLSRAQVLKLESEGVYRQSSHGPPAWSADGRILKLLGDGFVEFVADAQIDPQHPAFIHDALCASFVETTEGEKFRVHSGNASFDCPVSALPRFDACLDVCGVGDALVLLYTDSGGQASLAVWRA